MARYEFHPLADLGALVLAVVIARNPSGSYSGWRFIIALVVARVVLEFVFRAIDDRIKRRGELKRDEQREHEKQALDELTRKGIRPRPREDNEPES
jgi:hypothetical protein